jgi:Tol biopolymer transport system component
MRLAAFSTAFVSLLTAAPIPRMFAQGAPYSSRKVVDIVDTLGCWGLAEPASGQFIVYADRRGIHVVNQRTGKTTAEIGHTTAPVTRAETYLSSSLSISASGRRLAFLASDASGTVAHVWSVDLDTVTGKPVNAPHRVSIMTAAGLAISDDGQRIALVTADSVQPTARLLVIPSDGGDERVLDTAPRIETPRWSPDGKTIYYIRGRGKGPALARINAAGGIPDSLAPGMSVIGVSADGQRVAYYPFNPDNRPVLRVADRQGREIATVLGAGSDVFLMWSRRQPATMFSRRGEWATTWKTVSLDNGQVSPSSFGDRSASAPRFSADGRRLAATTAVDGRAQIVVYDFASNERRVLRTAAEPVNWAPDGPSMQWSPDGSHIAFLAVDSSFTRHDLYVVDVTTSQSVRLADLGPQRWSNATLFRWRSDGQAIDYISGASAAGAAPSLERVTLSGKHSVISKLPVARQGNATDGGYRLLNDSLVAVGRNPRTDSDSSYLAIVDARTGVARTVINKPAHWDLSDNTSILSPDGKWFAFGTRGGKGDQTYSQGAIASLDGKTVRMIGEPTLTPCRKSNFYGAVWPHEWLPDSRSLVVLGDPCSASRSHVQVYVAPIDGTPARHLPMPSQWDPDVTLMPDGRSLLVAAINEGSMSIVALDLTRALGSKAPKTATPSHKSGMN